MTGNADHISDRAAHWILRQEEPGWNAGDQAELDAWLEESLVHRAAWLRLRQGWREADRIAALGPEPSSASAEAPPPFFRRWQPWAIAASLAALVAGATGYRHWVVPDAPAEIAYATKVGARRSIALEDGSRVELNTATRLRSAVTADRRREVWLDQGEAFFEIVHAQGRPFVVHAGNRDVTVLGTKFSVRRDAGRVTVSVKEGRVRVDDVIEAKSVRSTIIAAGDMAIARGASTIVTAHAADKVEDALAWRDGMLAFNQTRLADAAAEFNRYNAKKLVVADPQAAEIRIDGAFQASNAGDFVKLLSDAYGLETRDEDGRVIISH